MSKCLWKNGTNRLSGYNTTTNLCFIKTNKQTNKKTQLSSKGNKLMHNKMRSAYGVTCVLNCFSRVWLFVTPWTAARQVLLSREFSRQENWSGLPCLPPGDLPNPGIKSTSIMPITDITNLLQHSPLLGPVIAPQIFTTVILQATTASLSELAQGMKPISYRGKRLPHRSCDFVILFFSFLF